MTDAANIFTVEGGWWATTPESAVWQRTGTTERRLIVPFTVAEGGLCFTSGSSSQMDPALPPQLAARGVTQKEWSGVMAELMAVQRRALGMCATLLILLTCILTPLICITGRDYMAHLRLWLDRLNSAHLQPRGMLAKFQTAYVLPGSHRMFRQWLAIALTPDECAQLASESGFWQRQRSSKLNPAPQ